MADETLHRLEQLLAELRRLQRIAQLEELEAGIANLRRPLYRDATLLEEATDTIGGVIRGACDGIFD